MPSRPPAPAPASEQPHSTTNAAATLFYELSDSITFESGFSYARDKANYRVNGGFRVDGERVFSGDPYDNDAKGWIVYGKISAELGDFNLTSISSYANTENVLRVDDTDAVDMAGLLPDAVLNDPTIDFSLWADKETEFQSLIISSL